MRLQLKEPESGNGHANGAKSPGVLAAGPVFKGCRWNPKRAFAIQPSFTAWVDLGSLKELSGGEAEVGVRPWALLCREGPRVTRLPFFLLTRWLELSLSTSGFSASIHRALSTCQLRTKHTADVTSSIPTTLCGVATDLHTRNSCFRGVKSLVKRAGKGS